MLSEETFKTVIASTPLISIDLIVKNKLGWVPDITVEQMCSEMVANDLDKAKQHAILKEHGYNIAVTVES